MVILDKAWQAWIIKKHKENCPHEEIYAEMLKTGLDESTALFNLVVFTTVSDHLASAAPNAGYVQEPSILAHLPNFFEMSDGQKVSVRTRIKQPDIVLLDNFLSSAECDALREIATPLLAPTVTLLKDATAIVSDIRTAVGVFLPRRSSTLITKIEERVAELTNISIEHCEDIQVLKYGLAGKYEPHFDYFDGDTEELSPVQHPCVKGGKRTMTLIMYLNDVSAGGSTVFPHQHLNIYPAKGSALFFSYLNSQRQHDPSTLHGGMPVIKGEKWIATKWFREKAFTV